MDPAIPVSHFLNILNLSWAARQNARARFDTVGEARGESVPGTPPPGTPPPDTPPPEYTESSSQGHSVDALPKSTSHPTTPTHSSADPYPILSALVQLHRDEAKGRWRVLFFWGLVQIMAVTFSADFQKLQADIEDHKAKISRTPARELLYETKKNFRPRNYALEGVPFSILTEYGTAALEQLCALVRNLENNLRRNRWPSVGPWDKMLLINLVLKPAQHYNMPADYALELLGRYKYVEAGGGVVKTDTMLDYWTPSLRGIRPKCTAPMLDLGDTLASHASVIEVLKTIVLEEAFATFQKENGMDKLQNSKELQVQSRTWTAMCSESSTPKATCFWPVSDGYCDLAKVLSKSGNIPDVATKIQRTLLRAQRRNRSYFQIV